MKKTRVFRQPSPAAIAAARGVIRLDGAIKPMTPVGRLSDVEWGWLVAAILFGWIHTRSEQAVAEHIDTELAIRAGLDPDPWDAGAVATILPELGATPNMDWSKPLADWPREQLIAFLTTAFALICKAVIARDLSDNGITRKSSTDMMAREANADADEFDDEIGF